ncbi:MAG: hypothetical protein H7210_14430 [Pyrinomonadaceae bacterium]|nr:hypothetical protein [Phycisphaerales bacterium]
MTMRGHKNNGTNRSARRMLASALLASAIMAGGVMPGCQKESDEAQAIRQAKLDFEYLAANHVGVADGSVSKRTYEKIVSSLSKAAGSSNPGEAAAAKLLRARANARQAELLAMQASRTEGRVLDTILVVRGSLNQWKDLNASAAALTAYDPSKAFSDLDQQIAEKEKEIAAAQADLTKLEGEVSTLQASVSAAQASVLGERSKEAALRTQAIDTSQTQRADLVTRANQAKRAGDGFDKQSSDLQAQISKMNPTVEEAKNRLAAARSDRALLDVAKGEVTKLVRINAEQSKKTIEGEKDAQGNTTRYGARQMSENLTRQVATLRSLREKMNVEGDEGSESSGSRSLMATYDEALKLYESAAIEAGKAKSTSGVKGGPAELDVATYEHGQADVLIAKARGLQAYSSLMSALAGAQPSLPDASFAAEAAEAKKAFDEALLAAQDAYSKARSTYETAGAKVQAAQVKDRLDQIGRTLATFDPRAPAPPPEAMPDAAPPADGAETAVTPGADGTPPTPPTAEVMPEGLEGEVLTTMQALIDDLKKPDMAAFGSNVIFKNEQQQEGFTRMSPLLAKSVEVDKAAIERFGGTVSALTKQHKGELGPAVEAMGFEATKPVELAIDYLMTAEPSDLQVIASPGNPDEVSVTSKTGKLAEPMTLSKIDGAWKLQLDSGLGDSPLPDAMIPALSTALEEIRAGITEGNYADAVAMLKDLVEKAVAAARSAMEPPK